MSERPKRVDNRTATAIRFKPEIHEALAKASAERDVSINWLVNRAVADFLPRLIPADEIRWTRDFPPTSGPMSTTAADRVPSDG